MTTDWLGLKDQVCVVTGAVGGMGTKICGDLAAQKATVVALDRQADPLNKLVNHLKDTENVSALDVVCDVTDEASVQRAVAQVKAAFGRVDVVINTAGILKFDPLEDLDYATWKQVLDVNLNGYYLVTHEFGKLMIAQKHGTFVHISTVASDIPETYSGAYSTSKAGVNMLSKQVAAEWGMFGIRSNVLEPCLVKTPMSAAFYADPQVENGRKELTASKRIGTTQDIANAILFLASDRSSYVNAAALPIDGGFSVMMQNQIPKPGGRRGFAETH
ncbi:SDR family NAD(P)-dependent oxidoreductase [Levilactobacillus acidifarinae]|uniref:Short-chain dehydrogenase oxidoreductase n=1 Tax=Levilactobacillus acidifarinae DSM 19394 = JCM 15949 TaxID=1423715 RepID=A0A0R1LE21_9LACO|nr:SDR family oxidoreductase [Levilactobacillus acidifarinae]KRK94046.1 short-chain dehydrogenase oxidoreductase [Levilactobacillus acidifarinae DSM 19394]GEO69789.1 2-deoxy-D-gluconate 3-dehydrogenase [Levilactobacillus acidifarinae]